MRVGFLHFARIASNQPLMTRFLTACCILLAYVFSNNLLAQGKISGEVRDADLNETMYGVNVIVLGSSKGISTGFDGNFEIEIKEFPVTLTFSFIGYITKKMEFTAPAKNVKVILQPSSIMIDEAEVVGERISEKQRQAPLTVETMDLLSIKEAPSGNFYEGLGNLKGVDLTTAGLGFKIINTRGFNSTSPVRSLQLIDGVDNQSPGLNFSLGNFLGASDLDVMKVDLISGASSAFFGPGAFNGVVTMQTKDPFIFPGFALALKKGERGLFEQSFRLADFIVDKNGEPRFGFKLNWFYMEARDWEARDYSPVFGASHGTENPFGFDGVNVYGDEPVALNNDFTDNSTTYKGLGIFYRNGYKEEDLVDYGTDNKKFQPALFYKIKPDLTASYNLNYSTGSTVYQGDNRYRLQDVQFWQNKLELKKDDKWFIRGYQTAEDAGRTYDIVTTGIRLNEAAGSTADWNTRFASTWINSLNIDEIVEQNPTYQQIFNDALNSGLPPSGQLELFQNLLQQWYLSDYDYFNNFYQQTVDAVNATSTQFINPFYAPGTARFDSLYSSIVSRDFTQGGSRFFDRSKLYHLQGEYKFNLKSGEDEILDLIIGANGRWYRPDSRGTIFRDSLAYTYQRDSLGFLVLDDEGRRIATDSVRTTIENSEWGAYLGLEKKLLEDKLKLNLTGRLDKNQNFDYLFSPAASAVYSPEINHTFRFTFSSAIRNPTLADQYLYYNVGRAVLLGNVDGRFEAGSDSLFTIDSFNEYRNSSSLLTGFSELDYFNVDRIRPEKVRTLEGGYRGMLWEKVYVDLTAYYSIYRDFIGFVIGLDGNFDPITGYPIGGLQAYRVAANANDIVTTQGATIGLNYFYKRSTFSGNYSWNRLISGDDDPIIPAFNTPEHKFNLGVSGRDITLLNKVKNFGYSLNYKWIQGFLFEGSPQFSGPISTYDMIDAQVNVFFPKAHCTVKAGGSNIMGLRPFFRQDLEGFGEKMRASFSNMNRQVYGGPLVGRLLFISVVFELTKKL